MYKVIDAVAEKVDRQLRRARDKVVDHKIPAHRERLVDRENPPAAGPIRRERHRPRMRILRHEGCDCR